MQWVRRQMDRRGVSQAELAAAIGLSESQMSKVMGGTRKLSSDEADEIRRFFGFRLPDDEGPEAMIFEHLSALRDEQKVALAQYLQTLTA